MMTRKQRDKIVQILRLYECFGIKYLEPFSFTKENLQTSQTLPEDYGSLSEYVEHCNLCELSKSCDKNLGFNDPLSDIYIVGINCNFEDINIRNNIEYFFQNILEKDFNQVYMTNIIKCNTKSDDFNNAGVISLCKDYFFQELAIGKPKYIFATLDASRYILKTDMVDNSFVGKNYKIGDSVIFPIFDFNFLSKNPSYKNEMERVFKKIKGLIS